MILKCLLNSCFERQLVCTLKESFFLNLIINHFQFFLQKRFKKISLLKIFSTVALGIGSICFRILSGFRISSTLCSRDGGTGSHILPGEEAKPVPSKDLALISSCTPPDL
jgi:hypothetical protein